MKKNIQMVDLHGQYMQHKSEIDTAISSVIEHSEFINGTAVSLLKQELAAYLDVSHVITCANGTDALTLALWALDLPPNSEIITADFTFIATAEAIARVGLTPILVDVDEDTFTINTDAIEAAITDKTKAIIPVHLFGQAADMNTIMQIAKKHNLFVIEDAAQCFGASYEFNGARKKLGTIGDIACTSFFPSKNLGCFGDGGALFTNNTAIAERLQILANHGSQKKYYHSSIGVNSRLDSIQAAILRVKLNYINSYNAARKHAAELYTHYLQDIPWITTPQLQKHSEHVFHQYTITLSEVINTDLQTYLKQQGIPSMIYYPVPMHKQEALASYNPKSCAISESLCTRVLSLPMHTELTPEEIEYICTTIRTYKP